MSEKPVTKSHGHGHPNNARNAKAPPETVIDPNQSSKRNILRKGKPTKFRKDHASGKLIDITDYDADEVPLDEHDPVYDPMVDESLLRIDDIDIGKATLTLSQYKRVIEPLISSFFINGDFDDFQQSINDINTPSYGYELVKRLINMSLDKNDHEREMVSQVLCYLHPNTISTSMLGKGFERLFELVDEIEKDAPLARDILSKFLARCVFDEILTPSFLNDPIVLNLGSNVVEHAIRMLNREHAMSKLEHVWGPGDGRPVEELKIAIDQLLLEYLLSKDMKEAVKCVLELKSSFFYHEIVKRAVVSVLDKTAEEQLAISRLFKELKDQGYLTSQQAKLGFNRLFGVVSDLVLDVPNASKVLFEFANRAIEDGVLPKDFTPKAE